MLNAIGALVVAVIIAMGVIKALDFLRKKAEISEEKKD